MAIRLKQVIATVLINRPNFIALIPQVYHGQISQPLPSSPQFVSISNLGFVELQHCSRETEDEASHTFLLPIEKAQGHFSSSWEKMIRLSTARFMLGKPQNS